MIRITTCARLFLLLGVVLSARAQKTGDSITLERGRCFGPCPVYILKVEASGAVSFNEMPGSRETALNRSETRTTSIKPTQFAALVTQCTTIGFFKMNDVYEPRATDGSKTIFTLTLAGRSKTVEHFEDGPPELIELEREFERMANTHRWLHDDAGRYSLALPTVGPKSSAGEDIKRWGVVTEDVYTRTKPGFSRLMQAAGYGDSSAIRAELQRGGDVNAADESGWTALMVAAASSQAQSVSQLVEAGARLEQRDRHRNTALMAAVSRWVPDPYLRPVAETARALVTAGAAVDATNDLGETALMWAARTGNVYTIRLLLQAGADASRVDSIGHNALFYLKKARSETSYDSYYTERYAVVEAAMTGK